MFPIAAVLVCTHLGGATGAAQGLDRNAQRFVNDATRDLKSRDPAKRATAVELLATWGKLATAPLVIGALSDPDPRVREAAAEALWDDDMKTPAATGPLTKALSDPSPEVAVLAAGALRLNGASKADVQQANERGLSSSREQRIRFLAARALIGLTPPARLVGPIVEYLDRQSTLDERVNIELAEGALEELRDTRDRTIVAPLMDAVPRMEKGAQIVLKVLGGVQPRPDGWTAFVVAQATTGDPAVRRQSMLLMRDLRADADVARWAPLAARLLATDTDDVVRSYAASALEFAAGGASAHADAVLSAARGDRSASVRASAFDALAAIIGRTGTAPMSVKSAMAKAALPIVQAAIDADQDEDVRENAIEALDALALDPAQSATLLAGIASRTSLPEGLRTQAIAKLRNRGPEAKSAAADLQKLKSDPSAVVRDRAVEALDRITVAAPGRAAAVPPVTRGATATASKPTAEDEARGLSVIRARKIEFVAEQFYRALGETDVDLVRAFLDAGMSPRDRFAFSRKETPLYVAVSSGACDPAERPTGAATLALVQLLITRGADASVADENGNTPLMEAASNGCDAVVMRTLLKAGAQLGAVNSAGLTAFEFGLYSGHDGLEALIAAGYRLPAAKVKMYLDAYKANPKSVALIKRASP
jgi:HEAT repeat protein